MIKLNLNCKEECLLGFINIDEKEKNSDFCLKLDNLWVFANNSVEEIYGQNMEDCFIKYNSYFLLTEWKRILRPGGKLVLFCKESLNGTFISISQKLKASKFIEIKQTKGFGENFKVESKKE